MNMNRTMAAVIREPLLDGESMPNMANTADKVYGVHNRSPPCVINNKISQANNRVQRMALPTYNNEHHAEELNARAQTGSKEGGVHGWPEHITMDQLPACLFHHIIL